MLISSFAQQFSNPFHSEILHQSVTGAAVDIDPNVADLSIDIVNSWYGL